MVHAKGDEFLRIGGAILKMLSLSKGKRKGKGKGPAVSKDRKKHTRYFITICTLPRSGVVGALTNEDEVDG